MHRLCSWIACCTAIALLAAALPAPAAAPAAAEELAPCHTTALAPTSHNGHCAQGCDSSPALDGAGPDWAPQSTRQPEAEIQPGQALIPAYRLEFQPARPPRIFAAPRAPPAPTPATPVARHDRLLN